MSFAPHILRMLVAGTAAALLMSPAQAEDIEQVFIGAQEALNSLLHEPEGGAAIPTDSDSESTHISLDQSGLNTANLISSEGSIANASQSMTGTQLVSSIFETTNNNITGTISQVGENFGNVIVADSVETVAQHMNSGTQQTVENFINSSGFGLGVTQVGRNTGNYVLANVSIGSGEQIFPEGVVQLVSNVFDASLGAMSAEVSQIGTNIGNVMEASHVEDVTRVFSGDQIIENTVILNPTGPRPASVHQEGSNIANLVIADSVRNLNQISNGTQDVTNLVLSPTLEELTEELTSFTSSTSNYANVLVLNGEYLQLDETDGSSLGEGGPISAQQNANYTQNVQADGSHAQVGNAVEITR